METLTKVTYSGKYGNILTEPEELRRLDALPVLIQEMCCKSNRESSIFMDTVLYERNNHNKSHCRF